MTSEGAVERAGSAFAAKLTSSTASAIRVARGMKSFQIESRMNTCLPPTEPEQRRMLLADD
jgi:hypothetical protein